MDVATRHQIRVAKKTLNTPDAIVNILGGITKAEARAILKKHNIKVKDGE